MHISLACSFKIVQREAASSTEISVCLCTEFGIGSLCSVPLHRKHWRRQMLHRESNTKHLHRLNSNDSFQNILFFFHMQAIFRLPLCTTKASVSHTHTMGQWIFQIYDTRRNERQDNRNYTVMRRWLICENRRSSCEKKH